MGNHEKTNTSDKVAIDCFHELGINNMSALLRLEKEQRDEVIGKVKR
ncbi:hypothetical protein [Alkaliphilus metalliredigens]|nr:hypothetical protein [Alkaliphilus metalliredigens]